MIAILCILDALVHLLHYQLLSSIPSDLMEMLTFFLVLV